MRICGVEIKGSEAILAVVDVEDDQFRSVDMEPKKIALQNDEDSGFVKSFFDTFGAFIRDNQVERIVIKKRSKKGEYAGGVLTFKIEGLIQLIDGCTVGLIAPQTITAVQKKKHYKLPGNLNKYQEQAFLAAVCSG
jgi:hypothetical protein